jgi:hypothetical protein
MAGESRSSGRRAPAGPVVDFSARLRTLAVDICARVPELSHIDPQRVLFCISRSRAAGTHGVYARIAPLRFADGKTEYTRRRGRYVEHFRQSPFFHDGREILYLIHLMLPRFLRLSFEQKLSTILHELYHISERCDGDIRRFAGRNFAHGSSRRAYNRRIAELATHYRASGPDPALLDFLHLTEDGWLRREYRLSGVTVPLPRARLVARKRV